MLPGGPSPLPFLGRDAYPPNPKSENHPIETLPWAHSLLFIQYSCCNLQSFNFTSSPSPLPALETARETEIDPNSQACLWNPPMGFLSRQWQGMTSPQKAGQIWAERGQGDCWDVGHYPSLYPGCQECLGFLGSKFSLAEQVREPLT